jgi:hypothetical protein
MQKAASLGIKGSNQMIQITSYYKLREKLSMGIAYCHPVQNCSHLLSRT